MLLPVFIGKNFGSVCIVQTPTMVRRAMTVIEKELHLQASGLLDYDADALGYNANDNIPASALLRDGYGQCNTNATLLMALLRALSIPCLLHGFTIHKPLQRGIVPDGLSAPSVELSGNVPDIPSDDTKSPRVVRQGGIGSG